MKSRWYCELQRRLGSPALWHMVSFTGKFDVALVQKISGDPGEGSAQTLALHREPTQELTKEAQRARERWRYAEHLKQQAGQERLSEWQKAELALLTDGTLLRMANDATRKSGFGRIRREDGGHEDIARHNGGIVRTILHAQRDQHQEPLLLENVTQQEEAETATDLENVVDWTAD